MTTKKDPKKPVREDWHNADIKAALEKAGWSLRQLSLKHGYAAGSLRVTLTNHWLRGEKIIADAIGVSPFDIWPSRFEENDTANTRRCNVKQRRRDKHEQSQKR